MTVRGHDRAPRAPTARAPRHAPGGGARSGPCFARRRCDDCSVTRRQKYCGSIIILWDRRGICGRLLTGASFGSARPCTCGVRLASRRVRTHSGASEAFPALRKAPWGGAARREHRPQRGRRPRARERYGTSECPRPAEKEPTFQQDRGAQCVRVWEAALSRLKAASITTTTAAPKGRARGADSVLACHRNRRR